MRIGCRRSADRAIILERSLILLEQRGGAPVQAVMQPGATVGTSHMDIQAAAGPLFSGQLGADNYGNRYSGQNRATALLNLNSPRGVGDLASLWLMKSSDSDAVFAAYQTPVGYSGLTLGASYSQFNYQLCCEFLPLDRERLRQGGRPPGALSADPVAAHDHECRTRPGAQASERQFGARRTVRQGRECR